MLLHCGQLVDVRGFFNSYVWYCPTNVILYKTCERKCIFSNTLDGSSQFFTSPVTHSNSDSVIIHSRNYEEGKSNFFVACFYAKNFYLGEIFVIIGLPLYSYVKIQ